MEAVQFKVCVTDPVNVVNRDQLCWLNPRRCSRDPWPCGCLRPGLEIVMDKGPGNVAKMLCT